ncbi:HAD-IA family hydrolase [Thalassotalea sp. M1531]|uniref:HAD-IA family hydrolase n=1 Tax=Thalassotalea algicola TaxID=2716224 RepID=A0A7Y0LA03_9GAMM|nr:HAD-IA family hydrolase [Thalassotalea algicola]NMP30718.1 HAD-IA family hydrolase [Thalassotalea algicola]
MKFYRSLAPIKAISFDLDDTLYSNRPVMLATEQAMLPYFSQLLSPYCQSRNITFDKNFWRPYRIAAFKQNEALINDVTQLRLATYTMGIASLNVTAEQAQELAQQAMAYFLTRRCDFTVPDTSLELLSQLRAKYPLVAISNGNVDTNAIGLDKYFDHIYHAGNGLDKKPAPDLFMRAGDELAIPCRHILHVGDCGYADIIGALRAGMQAAWLSCYDVGKPITVLPHIEINNVAELAALT